VRASHEDPPTYIRCMSMPQRPRQSARAAATLPVLPYRKPTRGRDYWVIDDVFPEPDAAAIRARCLAKDDWVKGHLGELARTAHHARSRTR